MSVPDFQSLMLAVLSVVGDGEITAHDLRDQVAQRLKLTGADLAEMVPSGRQTTFANRVAWANVFLQRAGLIEKAGRGRYRPTQEGRNLLNEQPEKIDQRLLARFPSFVEWRRRCSGDARPDAIEGSPEASRSIVTPEEQVAQGYEVLTRALVADVLERVRQMPPTFFETLIVDLLIKLGYGGGNPAMGKAIGRSNDGGIDCVIKEDALGLDIIYVQAKRYGPGQKVGRPEVQAFAGSLDGVGATKGIFITTASFTASAREFASRIAKRLILLDGDELARMMVERQVGVRVSARFELKSIDENYFITC